MVKVLIFGHALRQAVEEPEIECAVTEPMSVRELLTSRQDVFQPLQPFLDSGQVMVTVNHKVSTLEARIKDGDTVKLTHQFNPQHEGALWHNP